MLIFAKLVSAFLAFVVFGVLRVVTRDMGDVAWAVSLVAAIVAFFILRAIFVSPLVKRATNKASVRIIEHFAGGGNMSGAIRIAKGLGLSTSQAAEVAEAHKDALVREIAERIFKEAKDRYQKNKDKEEIRRYFREKGIPDEDINKAVDRVVKES
ncbi:MAG: hypothetical protein A2Z25_15275 [Planctomycetes bacterium RBG_16_55_9]|nr:MAG: hypothetical protein A2Z25_15275 [Planctomycetes bacterium RBG_16_55_9]